MKLKLHGECSCMTARLAGEEASPKSVLQAGISSRTYLQSSVLRT